MNLEKKSFKEIIEIAEKNGIEEEALSIARLVDLKITSRASNDFELICKHINGIASRYMIDYNKSLNEEDIIDFWVHLKDEGYTDTEIMDFNYKEFITLLFCCTDAEF